MPGPKDWLEKALSDFRMAQKGSATDDTIDTAIFLTHQVAEKSLKAFLMFKQHPLLKTHDLLKLLEVCVQFDE